MLAYREKHFCKEQGGKKKKISNKKNPFQKPSQAKEEKDSSVNL